MSDVLLRHIEMLRMIPRNKMVTTSKIKARLETLGYVITERTIQRDLNELSRKFPIICDDTKKPYQWSMTEASADLDIPSMALTATNSQFASELEPVTEMQHQLTHLAARPKDIFFSYGHDDNRELVRRFKLDLEKRGHRVWFDEKNIGVWDDWREKITNGIDASDMAIAFISKHSIRDPGVCLNEIAIAMNRFGTIYPIILEDGIKSDIPVTIQTLQWHDLSKWKDIQDGKIPDTEWNRWYEEKLLSLITTIETDATRFSDEASVLSNTLQPATFESKVIQHVPGFVGREWIVDAYSHWVDHQPESRLFWIKAGPGVGKTAIAVNLANSKRGAICASWFCDAKSSELKDPSRALRTIAYQLALRWGDYRVQLLRKLQLFASATEDSCDNIREELSKKNTHDLFLFLLAEPMANLPRREHKLVIVIDALDEATDDHGNNRITELISSELDSLPDWIGFVVTSRPEAKVVNRLRRFKPFEMNAEDPRNTADLRVWYKKQLGQRPELTCLSEAEQRRIEDLLIERSEGMILYLKMLEVGFREGSLVVSKLDAMGSGLLGLYDIYYDSFQTKFGEDYEDSVKPLLRLLLAAGGPLPEDLACETLVWNSEQFLSCRNRLGSYVIETEHGYELFHKTLAEWLGDKSSDSYYVDQSRGRQMLADMLFNQIDNEDSHLARWKHQIRTWLPNWLPKLSQYVDSAAIAGLGSTLKDWAEFVTAYQLLELALAIREKTLSPDHLDIADSLLSLTSLLEAKGDYEAAEPLCRRALDIHEKKLGPDHSETADSLLSLASLLEAKGDYEAAEPLYRRALVIHEKTDGPTHPDTAASIELLALFLWYSKGDYEAAEPLHRRALAIHEKANGLEHDYTCLSLSCLASFLEAKGDYEAAEPLFRRALAIREKNLGPYHPNTSVSLNCLASLLEAKGDYEAAEPLFRRALAIREKNLGPYHPDTASALIHLAALLFYIGGHDEAEPLYRRALEILDEVLAEHSYTKQARLKYEKLIALNC
jgi:tetratricopeptide (TPR) repeat protein